MYVFMSITEKNAELKIFHVKLNFQYCKKESIYVYPFFAFVFRDAEPIVTKYCLGDRGMPISPAMPKKSTHLGTKAMDCTVRDF